MTILELQIFSRIAELEEYLLEEPDDWDAAQEVRSLTWLVENAVITEKEITDARRNVPA